MHSIEKQISRQYIVLLEKIEENNQSSSLSNDELSALNDKYLEYYQSLDEKSSTAINTIIAFMGCVVSAIVIVNTIIALKMPKEYEHRLVEVKKQQKGLNKQYSNLREKVDLVQEYAKKAKTSAQIAEALIKNTTAEKINALTENIEDEGIAELYFTRGFLYDSAGKYDEAESDYEQAIEVGGSDYTYSNYMGILYHHKYVYQEKKNEYFDEAKKYYLQTIDSIHKKNKKASYNYCNLASLYDPKENLDKALEYYKLSLDEDENFEMTYLMRGSTYEQAGENYYEQAFDDYSRVLKINSENEMAMEKRINLAIALLLKTHNAEYLRSAKADIRKIRKRERQYKMYEGKIKDATIKQLMYAVDKTNIQTTVKTTCIDSIDKKMHYVADGAEKNPMIMLAGVIADMGNFYSKNGELSSAVDFYKKAKEIYDEEIQDEYKIEYELAIKDLEKKIKENTLEINNQ